MGGDCLAKALLRIVFFQVKKYFTGLTFYFFAEVVRIGSFRLIAENVEDFRVVAGFNKTIATI